MESGLQVWEVLLAISVFLTVVAWDIVKSCKKGDKWIQGSGLTLTALTVQFLGYFDAQNVNPFGKFKGEELQMLLDKQLSVDIARLVFCVFLGCVLPGVAFNGSGGRWSNIAALAVSLSLHMVSEVYVLQNVDDHAFRNGEGKIFILSRVPLLFAAVSLVLYIGLAVLYCRFTRDRLSLMIPRMLKGRVKGKMLDENKCKVFKFWAIVRGCQQEFWLSSSAFTPAVLVIVTTCVAAVVAKPISRPSLLLLNNNIVTLSLCLQCVFILTGWVILVWRWLIFLLLLSPRKKDDGLLNYVGYTWVCGIRFCWLVYLYIRTTLNLSLLNNVWHFKCIPTIVWKALRLSVFLIFLTTMLPMGFFFVVICILMLFNVFCWLLSSLLVSCVVKVAQAMHCTNMFKALVLDAEVLLETETGEYLYVADSSNKHTECAMKEAYSKGKSSQKILQVIKHSVNGSRKVIRNQISQIENKDEYDGKGIWKMAAVAAIAIIAELAYGWDSNEMVKDTVQAYKEAQDLLRFLDSPSNITVNPLNLFDSGCSRAYQTSLEADIKMQEIEKLIEINNLGRAAFDEVLAVVSDFKEKEESSSYPHIKFCQYWSGETGLDTIKYDEGAGHLKRISMKCVCGAILRESCSNERELVDRAMACLGDVIVCGIFRLPVVLRECCNEWATELKEENLRKALELQEKFRAIKENWTSANTAQMNGQEKHNLEEDIKVDVEETETRNWTSADTAQINGHDKHNLVEDIKVDVEETETRNWTSPDRAPTRGTEKNNLSEDTKADVQETETRNLTSSETAPTSGQGKNILLVGTKLAIQETDTRKREYIGAEGDIEGEIIDVEAK